MKAATKRAKREADDSGAKRRYLKQSDVPSASLDEALRVPQAILEHYAGKPTAPLYVAKALNIDPKGSQLKVLSGAAIAFGLVEGGSQASSIAVTELARRILKPKAEGQDLVAKREALLRPRVFGDFLQTYDSHPFPRQDIARNVLEDMGVPSGKTVEVLARIETSARSVGFLEDIKDKTYVSLGGTKVDSALAADAQDTGSKDDDPVGPKEGPSIAVKRLDPLPAKAVVGTELSIAIADDERRRRVFITHGKNRDLVDPIRKLLEYGELIPIIAVERQSVSKPVPEKVMDDMRGCGAAIIHIDVDQTITDTSGTEHVLLNPNVLIEIGAAMAFYGRRFILLVRDGVKLPSNLQGLYEVRYAGDTLDANSTIRLLEAIKDIKNYELPTERAASEA